MPRRTGMQKDLFTQLAEARTPQERAAIELRMRHAEAGIEGERPRIVEGLLVNGTDPYAALRGAGRPVYEDQPREERTETRMTTQAPQPQETRQYVSGARRLDQIQPPASDAKVKRKSPVWPDRRSEIIYCPQCRRQLQDGEYESAVTDIVMTTHGGIRSTLVTCKTHGETIALKTEFVILAKKSEPAS